MFRKLGLIAFIATLGFGVTASDAARVTPMTIEMTPTGRGSTARIEVTNSENRDLPMEVRMYRGDVNEAGELTLTPADDRFVVFPPQVVIGANQQQVFRIQYLTDGPMTRSEVYYAAVSQIPVDLAPTSSRIQVVMRFNVLVNIVPEGTRADPVITFARPVRRDVEIPPDRSLPTEQQQARTEVQQGIEVRVENRGTKYFAAGRIAWTLSGTGPDGAAFSETRTAGNMGDAIGFGLVPPGGARIFFVPTDTLLTEGTVNVRLGG